MITEALDFRFLLLENYKKMKLNENELATILMMDYLISQGNPFITADLLSLKMSLNVQEIDKIVASMLTRGFIEYKTLNLKTVTSLNPLKEKLFREFTVSVNQQNDQTNDRDVNESLNNIFGEFEKELNRPLSPVEFSKIREWVSYGYSDELIINALKDALMKGKKSLRSVDKILLEWASREDIEKEGHTSLSSEWDKNLEETIKIAKTPWLTDKDEK